MNLDKKNRCGGFLKSIYRYCCTKIKYLTCHKERPQIVSDQQLTDQIIDGSSIAIFVIDKNHTVTYWNKVCENLTGIKAKDIIGTRDHWKAFYDEPMDTMADMIVDSKDLSEIEHRYGNEFKKSILLNSAFEVEKFFPRIQGGAWLTGTVSPLTDADGNIIGAVETILDITKQKKIQEALCQTSQTLETIIESVPFGIVIVNSKKRIKSINAAALNIIKQKREDVIGKVCHRAFCPTQEGKCPVWDMKQKINRAEQSIHDRDGKKIPILKTCIPLVLQGEEVLLEAFVDIADLVDSKRLAQEASRVKSEFLANMSHEIRTPMNAIIGFGDLLMETELTEEQLDYLKTMTSSGHNLLTLINGILDLSKIESGRLSVEMVNAELEPIVNHLESLMLPLASKKKIELHLRTDPSVPKNIVTDPIRLSQCLINLVSNAIKFTKKGRVYVNITPDTLDGKSAVRVDIKDTGVGIPKEKQKIIFESFSQADNSTTRKYGGTGLGLTITKKLVELMDGQIQLESVLGKGTVFSIVLPTKTELITNEEEPHQNHAFDVAVKPKWKTFNATVLVAEDNLANQLLIVKLLEKHGITVTVASDGQQALHTTQKGSFDMVLMDMQMPVMNGYEATRTLRAAGISVPIVALTASAMIEDRKKCLNAGCDDYLRKPIDRTELQNTLERYLGPATATREQIDQVKKQADQINQLIDGTTQNDPSPVNPPNPASHRDNF